MKLIVITNPTPVANEASVINDLFSAGLKYMHIRKPEGTEKEVTNLLLGISPHYYDRIALHQFHHIAKEFKISRLHFGEEARELSNVKELKNLVDQGYTLTTSIHSVQRLNSLPDFLQYAFFGPVYDSISKKGYEGLINNGFLLPKCPVPVIALGGIRAEKIQELAQYHFKGIGVLGAIWENSTHAAQTFKDLKEASLKVLV